MSEDDVRRLSTTKPFTCCTCEVEIVGSPTIHLGLPFCCAGCAADGPCVCTYDPEGVDQPRVRHCLDVGDFVVTPSAARDTRQAVDVARR